MADDPLDAAWSALLDRWDEPERHAKFIELAHAAGRLPDAAARYRAVEGDPARAEGASRGKKLIIARAMAQLDAMPRTTLEEARGRGRWVAPIAALGMLFAFSFAMARATGNRLFVSPLALALEILVVALVPWRRLLSR